MRDPDTVLWWLRRPLDVTCWHRDPDPYRPCEWRARRWHLWHWRLQWRFLVKLRCWLTQRCEVCGRRFRWDRRDRICATYQVSPSWFRIDREGAHRGECEHEQARRFREVQRDRQLARVIREAERAQRGGYVVEGLGEYAPDGTPLMPGDVVKYRLDGDDGSWLTVEEIRELERRWREGEQP